MALGLDPEVLAARFRDHFLASGRPLADVAARWRLWCAEDAEDAERNATLAPKPVAATPATPRPGKEGGLAETERRMLDRWSERRAAGDHLGQLEADLSRQLSPAGLAELHRRQDAAGPTEADREWIERWEEAQGPRRQALRDRLPTLLSRPGLAAWRHAAKPPRSGIAA